MTDQRDARRSPLPAALTSVAGVAVVAVMASLAAGDTVPWAVTAIVGGVIVAVLLGWTATREIGRPESAGPAGPTASPTSAPRSATPHRSRPAAHATVSPADRARATWSEATARHDGVLSEYGQWELDPTMLLSYPALWDYSRPANQEFFAAMERCAQLRTGDIPGGPGSPHAEAVEAYAAATQRLATSWRVAEQDARKTGRETLSEELAKDADRALKLLRHADGATTEAEEASYLTQASTIVHRLSERGVIPPRTKAETALEVRRMKALESAGD
jgi:hypothetical protein